MIVFDLVAGLLVLAGAFFAVSAAVGLLRFPDFYTRVHAAGVGDTGGAGLVLLGLMVLSLRPADGAAFEPAQLLITVKLLFILFFMWLTGATACHAVAKAAWLGELKPWTPESDGGDPSKG